MTTNPVSSEDATASPPAVDNEDAPAGPGAVDDVALSAEDRKERIGRIVGMFLFPFLMVSMMITGYLGAMHAPTPHDMPIAVAGPVVDAQRFAESLESGSPGAVEVRVVGTDADARQLMLDREVSAAVSLPETGKNAVLYTAGGAGASQASMAAGLVAPSMIEQGFVVTSHDLAPLPVHDGAGLSAMFMMNALLLAGYMPLSLLLSTSPHLLRLRTFLPLLAGWSALASVLVWFIAGPIMGAVEGHAIGIVGIGFLTVFAVGMVQLFFTRIFGPFAVLVGMLFVMVLGVPASNMGMSVHALPALYPVLHTFLPGPAAGEALRSILYFGGAGIGSHLIVLAVGAVAALLATVVVDVVKRRRDPDSALPAPTLVSLTGGGRARKPVLYTTVALFPLAMITLMMSAMLGAMNEPAPKDMPVAVAAGSPEHTDRAITGLQQSMSGLLDLRAVADGDEARRLVQDRSVVAAYLLPTADAPHATLITNEAAGVSQQQVAEQVFTRVAAGQQIPLVVENVTSLSSDDTMGTVTLYVAMGWIMAGFMIIVVAANAFPPAMRIRNLLPIVAGWSVAMAVVLWVIADPLVGAVDGHFWPLVGIGCLAIFSTAMFTTVFVRLIGLFAVVPVIGVLMFLGIPASGGAMSIYMEPLVFRILHGILPMPAAVESVRSVLYFGADTVGDHLAVFAIWGVISLLAVVAIDRFRPSTHSDVEVSPQ
ncbi:ABC transporter permease [Nocardia sp. NPDC055165]